MQILKDGHYGPFIAHLRKDLNYFHVMLVQACLGKHIDLISSSLESKRDLIDTIILTKSMKFGQNQVYIIHNDIMTKKARAVIYSTRLSIIWSLKDLCQMIFKLLSRENFQIQSHCNLDLQPTNSQNNQAMHKTLTLI